MSFLPHVSDQDIIALWRQGLNTTDIARRHFVAESQIANRLPRLLERHRQDRDWEAA